MQILAYGMQVAMQIVTYATQHLENIYIYIWFEGNASQVMPIYNVLETSILICPFVYQHKECQHSDGEVPFGLITGGE